MRPSPEMVNALVVGALAQLGLLLCGLVAPIESGTARSIASIAVIVAIASSWLANERLSVRLLLAVCCALLWALVWMSPRPVLVAIPGFAAVLGCRSRWRTAHLVGTAVAMACSVLPVVEVASVPTVRGPVDVWSMGAASSVCVALMVAWKRPSRAGALVAVLAGFACFAIAWCVASWMPGLSAAPWLPSSAAALSAVLCAAAFGASRVNRPDAGPRWLFAIGSTTVTAGVVTLAVSLLRPPGDAVGRVTVFNSGGLDWERPQVGISSGPSSGMFGVLPDYLASDGIHCETVEPGEDLAAALQESDVFVVINCAHVWSDAELAAVHAFVDGGGGLLVLCDHTDVFGQMEPINSLLRPYDIGLAFDSAYPIGPSWEASATTTNPSYGDVLAGHAIGCSLVVGPRARRVVTAPWAFSDRGDRNNHMGSYLGNYRLDDGERLGGVVLAADARSGSGRVLVLGDTSALQSSGLPETYEPFVVPALRCLAGAGGAADVWRVISRWLVVLCAVMLLVWRCSMQAMTAVVVSMGLGLAATASSTATAVARDGAAIVVRDGGGIVGHYEAGYNAVGPLYGALHRLGAKVLDGSLWGADSWRSASCIALVDPRREFPPAKRSALTDWVESGGVCLIAAGAESARSLNWLTGLLGLRFTGHVLGRVPVASVADPLMPRTMEAWEIFGEEQPGQREVLLSIGGRRVGWACRHGRGWFLLLGDSRWFHVGNFDHQGEVTVGNIALADRMLARYVAKVAFPNPQPRFQSPEKPR